MESGARGLRSTLSLLSSHLQAEDAVTLLDIGLVRNVGPGADIGTDVRVGNFVEIKNAQLESGAKVNHLTYVGDARVGAGANIGAGTITCNYDGFGKHRTDIGTGAFIGSNTALVAPVRIGDGAIVGAGSTIAKDVAANSLAVTRASQRQIDGWAETFRDKKSSEKTKKNKA